MDLCHLSVKPGLKLHSLGSTSFRISRNRVNNVNLNFKPKFQMDISLYDFINAYGFINSSLVLSMHISHLSDVYFASLSAVSKIY